MKRTIICQKITGGFIFECCDEAGSTISSDERIVKNEVQAISVFNALIHGEELAKIRLID